MTILVLGDCILDEYWEGKSIRISPEAPVPVITDIKKQQKAGGAANVALNIHSMGSKIKFISQASLNFNKALLKKIPNYLLYAGSTPRKTRIIANNQVVCRIDDEEYQPAVLNPQWLTADVQMCVLSDYNKGFLHNTAEFIQECNERNIQVLVDPKKDWKHYKNAWLLKANLAELSQQLDTNIDIDNLDAICWKLSNEFNIPNLVVTMGSQGMFVWNSSNRKYIAAHENHENQVVDVTGAGDVVIAALAHYCAQGEDIFSAAVKANQLAAISVSKLGTYIVTAEDVKNTEKKLVFTNGCFDILHAGHISYLRQSRALGTELVVGINSDESVRKLKGTSRPINNQTDRKALLESLEFVDQVIVFDEATPYELIKKLQPDIITKGGDYTVDQVVGNDLVNQVVIIPFIDGYSTSNVIKMIGDTK